MFATHKLTRPFNNCDSDILRLHDLSDAVDKIQTNVNTHTHTQVQPDRLTTKQTDRHAIAQTGIEPTYTYTSPQLPLHHNQKRLA